MTIGERGGTHHHGPLAGVGMGTAVVLGLFGVLCLAWHRVAGQVSLAISMLAYAVIAAVAVAAACFAVYAVLWVRHRARNPELMSRQPARVISQQVQGETVPADAPPALAAREVPALPPGARFTADQVQAVIEEIARRQER